MARGWGRAWRPPPVAACRSRTGADIRQPAHAAADGVDSRLRDPGHLRQLGWALVMFIVAAVTDALDGSFARPRAEDDARRMARSDGGQAPARDAVHRADAAAAAPRPPHSGLADGARDQPRRRHRADGGDRQPGGRAAHVQAVDLRQGGDGDVSRHRHRHAAVSTTWAAVAGVRRFWRGSR